MAKRKKGDGSVHLRKDGRWEGRYVVGYDDRGYPKTKSVLAKTKRECVEKLDALKEALGGIKSDKIKPDMPFGEWIEYWFTNICKPRIRTATAEGYERRIKNHIIPEIGQIPLNKLTQNDLQHLYTRLQTSGRLRYVDKNGAGLSNSYVRSTHTLCRAALQAAVEQNLIKTNPAIGCKLPPKKAREMQVLTKDEMRRFLIQAKEEGMYELFLLELATGMRRGELAALQWDDLDFDTGELKIEKTIYRDSNGLQIGEPKTKASIRTVVLPEAVLDALRAYKRRVFSRWMFPSRVKDDAPIDPSYMRKILQDILEHAGCKKVRFHDLRHTFATSALERGMDVKTLSAVIGHVSAATTLDIYTHITDTMQQEAARSIDRGIGKNEAEFTHEEKVQAPAADFQPFKPSRRRPGTGYVKQIGENTWEGRYSPTYPDGTRKTRTIYARTEAECEEKLAEAVIEMNAEREKMRAEMRTAAK